MQFNFGNSLSGYVLSSGSGSIGGQFSLGVSGSVNASGAASGPIGGGITTLVLEGNDAGGMQSTFVGSYAGTAAPTTTTSYDAVGNVLTQTGPNGRATDRYNANNQLTRVIDGAGNTATSNHYSVGI